MPDQKFVCSTHIRVKLLEHANTLTNTDVWKWFRKNRAINYIHRIECFWRCTYSTVAVMYHSKMKRHNLHASFEHTHDALQLENVLLQIRDFLPVISLLVMLKLNRPRSLLSGWITYDLYNFLCQKCVILFFSIQIHFAWYITQKPGDACDFCYIINAAQKIQLFALF